MRSELLKLINDTIIYKYDLPYTNLAIDKTIFSTCNDKCYEAANQNDLAEIIYNYEQNYKSDYNK